MTTTTVPNTIPPSPEVQARNYGYNPDYEQVDIEEADWRFGSEPLPCVLQIPSADRDTYLPIGEVQKGRDDFMDCASRGPHNIEETKQNYRFRNDLILPENKKWLEDNGYIVWREGIAYIELSDPYLAIKSGTDRTGNSMKRPVHTLYELGAIPKCMLPVSASMTFEEYHDPKRITKAMDDLAREYRLRFPMNYVRLDSAEFDEANEREMIVVAAYAWPRPVDGIYPRSAKKANHIFARIRAPKSVIFDNYVDSVDGDFKKQLAPDYEYTSTGYALIFQKDRMLKQNIIDQLKFLLRIGDLRTFWDILRANFKGVWRGS